MHSAESHPTAPPDSDGSSNASLRPLANQMVAAASRFARTATQISGIRISAVSMRALAYIERHGPQRISHLANYESISQPAMTTAVNRLAQDGMVVRQPDPVDARAHLVALTDQGDTALQEYRRQVAAIVQPTFDTLSEADRTTLARAVEILESLTNKLTGFE